MRDGVRLMEVENNVMADNVLFALHTLNLLERLLLFVQEQHVLDLKTRFTNRGLNGLENLPIRVVKLNSRPPTRFQHSEHLPEGRQHGGGVVWDALRTTIVLPVNDSLQLAVGELS